MSKVGGAISPANRLNFLVLLMAGGFVCENSYAANSYSGATGLFYVPTAEVTPAGAVSLQQNNDQYLRPNNQYVQQFDLEWLYSGRSGSLNGTVNFSLGLFPRFEIGGRLSNFSLKTDGEPQSVLNDLSGNVKWQFLNWRDRCLGAIGALDFAGQAKNFSSQYLAATCSTTLAGKWTTTLAYVDGERDSTRPSGLVGGLTYKPFEYFQFMTEYEGEGWNTGFSINSGALLGNLKLSAVAKVHSTVAGTDSSVGLDLEFPLGYGVKSRMRGNANSSTDNQTTMQPVSKRSTGPGFDIGTVSTNSRGSSVRSEQRLDTGKLTSSERDGRVARHASLRLIEPFAGAVANSEEFRTDELIGLLDHAGFERIQVELSPDRKKTVVAYNDTIYRNSYLDSLAVAAGTVASYSAKRGINQVQIIVSKQGVQQVVVRFRPSAYVKFLEGDLASAPLFVRFATVDDLLKSKSTGLKTRYQLFLTPQISNFVGTELGVHDYSLAAVANLSAPLSRSLQLKAGYRVELDNTGDFERNGAFRNSRLETGPTNAYIEWAAKPARSITFNASLGFSEINTRLEPFNLYQLAFTPFDGRHQLTVTGSTQSVGDGNELSYLGTYSYFFVESNVRIELEGGRYIEDQTGYGLSVNRYFDDTIIRLFARGSDRQNLVAGLAVRFPLGGRRRSEPTLFGVQLGLEERFNYGLETTVNRADGTNLLVPRFLNRPNLPSNLREDYLEYQRLTPAYLNSQSERLRNAYYRFTR